MQKLVPTALALAVLGACDSGGSVASFDNESTLSVSPAEFDLACGSGDPEGPRLLSYSATLIDVTQQDDEQTIVSSPVTPCSRSLHFAFLNQNDKSSPQFRHRYVVEILGFAESDVSDPDPERATWSGSCGRGAPPPPDPELTNPGTHDAGANDAGASSGVSDAGATPAATGDAGTPAPLDPEELPDFYQDYWGPKQLISGRTTTFRGCWLRRNLL